MKATRLLYCFVLLFAPALVFGQPGPSFEPVVAAGEYHEVIYENERVRVLSVEIMPGERVPFHQHEFQSIFITLEPASLLFRDMSGKSVKYIDRADLVDLPYTEWREAPASPRSVENVDAVTMKALRVELK